MAGQVRGDVVPAASLTSVDLTEKDEAIILRGPDGDLVGFSTQRRITVDGVAGIFSGDTVVHPAHRGSPALLRTFARRYIFAPAEPLHWFLVSKGYRTYRMLPSCFRRYWPSRHEPIPDDARALMTRYATSLFPDDYNPATGVLEYRTAKDRLRQVTLSSGELVTPDVAFFVAANPGWVHGHDLVCLTRLTPDNLRPAMVDALRG
jgi:hypothetical protein